jgi:hypothetical protein
LAFFKGLKAYCQSRIAAFEAVGHVHRVYSMTKLKLDRWMNARRSEQRLISRVAKMFGKPSEMIIAVGDYGQKQYRKNKDPRKGKGMQEVLRKAGYEVVLVDEFQRTAACSGCKRDELECMEATMRGKRESTAWSCAKHAASCGRGTTTL